MICSVLMQLYKLLKNPRRPVCLFLSAALVFAVYFCVVGQLNALNLIIADY